MSQVKLTLRPPPNVDFVHGYPGIPPGGPDRPQAAVKGAVEVRAGPQGVKAKWVRIELRKVETLPPGGMSNTFYDYVAPSPVNLWTSSDPYGIIRTQDFPFSIRIPESIPPSIALEDRAGIQYELVASLCTKGKRGFFRKRKSVVVSTQASVIVDKHELHSTWPVYCQPETRQIHQDGCSLIVDRNQTCYGPGDRISVMALFRSDTIDHSILRGFELTLKENTTFRAGHHAGKKPVEPVKKSITIADSKLAINSPIHIGTEHRAELTCSISHNHTTTTLNSARHIDVTYVLSVKALLDRLEPLVIELPLIVSNWQRIVSQEAVRRIGPTPTLSLTPLTPAHQTITRSDPHASPKGSSTLPITKDIYTSGRLTPPMNPFNSLPAKTTGYTGPHAKVDEFGQNARPAHSHTNSIGSDESTHRSPAAVMNSTGRRPDSVGGKRLTLTTANPTERPQPEQDTNLQRAHTNPNPAAANTTTSPHTQWPSAEDEKQRLYEAAVAKVERTQGDIARGVLPPQQTAQTPPARNGPWPTAEEEKMRLFNQAQAAAQKTQEVASYSPPVHGRSNSEEIPAMELSRQASTSRAQPTPKKLTAAEIYSQAMNARNQAIARQQQQPGNTSHQRSPPKANVPQYLTAEQEKAALKRYHEAKAAVSRVQNEGYTQSEDGRVVPSSGPIAYEHLYPDNNASSSTPSSNDLPPPFETPANLIPASHLSEKERLHRAYEEQDAAAMARRNQINASPPPFSQPAPSPVPAHAAIPAPTPINAHQALSEKEALRRKLEAQDAARTTANGPPQPPPRSNSVPLSPPPNSANRSPRPKPAPPSSPGKVLTAAEEKALLKAQYAAQDARAAKQQQQQPQQQAKENHAGPSRPASSAIQPPINPSTPPPLMPRPPAEYIQETQEEDARVSLFAMNGMIPADDILPPSSMKTLSPPPDKQTFSSPLANGFQPVSVLPPPPLPPKPLGE